MRFLLSLTTTKPGQRITLNYQYPLSAAIYKIIQRADEDYAAFLHNEGYRHGGKTFKLFTFSDLRTPFDIRGDRMIMRTNTASLTICFHVPDAAENFIKGLFMSQQLDIADSQDKASFIVQQVSAEKMPELKQETVLLQPMSPVVVGRKNERGNYDYVSPADEDFAALVCNNLLEKYATSAAINEGALEQIKKTIHLQPFSLMDTLAIAISDNANMISGSIRAKLSEEDSKKADPIIDENLKSVDTFITLQAGGFIHTKGEAADALEKAEQKLIDLMTAYDYENQ